MEKNNNKLKRSLSILDLVVYGLVFMVPIAPFGVYGFIAKDSEGMPSAVYLLGLVAMFFTASSYASMSKAVPLSGSVYTYATKGIGDFLGFVTGWTLMASYMFTPAILYIVAGIALSNITGINPYFSVVFFTVINTLISVRGIAFTSKANLIILAFEVIVLFIFLLMGYFFISQSSELEFNIRPFYDPELFDISFISTALSLAVFSFLGFDGISTLAEENKGDKKLIGRAIYIALFVAGTFFVAQTYIAATAWSDYSLFKSLETAFYDISEKIGGSFLRNLVAFATIIAWGTANAIAAQTSASRILFSMSRDGNLPSFFSKIHPKFATPHISSFFLGFISLILGLIFLKNMDILTYFANYGALFSFCILNISVIGFFYFKKNGEGRSFLKHFILPFLGFLIVGYVFISIHTKPLLFGSAWTICGGLYYLLLKKIKGKAVINAEM